ncbi:MAG: cell division protein FtsQ/DivIB [Flavobacteriales bacterium]
MKKNSLLSQQKTWRFIFWIFIALTFICFLVLANAYQKPSLWQSNNIQIEQQDQWAYLRAQDLYEFTDSQLIVNNTRVVDALNKYEIKSILTTHPYVKSVDVFSDFDGVLHFDIQPKKPSLRIEKPNGNRYYLDKSGETMPFSEEYTAQVPIFYLEDEETENQLIFEFYQEVLLHPMAKTQLADIYVNSMEEFSLVPQFGDFLLELGNSEHLNKKLTTFEYTMKHILNTEGWDTYSKINLSFEGQIICTKKQQHEP